jgi:hypothetical protein
MYLPHGDVDLPSAELILTLQLGDIDELRANSKGKPRDGELIDAELAMSFMQENLESIAPFHSHQLPGLPPKQAL